MEAHTMNQAKVVVYGADWCGYCQRARALLERKGVSYEDIDVDIVPDARAQMQARSGRTSIPQIFIDGAHIGGCDELHALEADGRLDTLLKPTES
jgi:glutaredoxin 3